MKRLLSYLITLLSFLPQLHAQSETEEVSLKEYLLEVEAHYSVSFSYLEELMEDRKAPAIPVEETLSFPLLIRELEAFTQLKFERLDAKYFIIRSLKSTDPVSICGKVVDEEGTPLVAALINVGTIGRAITDEQGFFELQNIVLGRTFEISYLGYHLRLVPVSEMLGTSCAEIALNPDVNVLREFVLNDFAVPGVSKIQNSLVFRPDRLKLLPGWVEPDIMQTIQLSPGVSTPFESAANLFVRGSSPDQNLVLWNGIKTYSQSHFFGALSIFNPVIPQEVRFIKSGTDPYYGDRVAGVIDITTDPEIPEKFNGSAGLTMLNGDVYVSMPIVDNKLSSTISLRRSYSDLWETPTYDQFSQRQFQNTKIQVADTLSQADNSNRFFFQDLSASVVYAPSEDHTIRLNTLLTANELDFRSSSQNANYQDFLKTGSNGHNIQWRYLLTERSNLEVEAYRVNYGLFYEFVTVEQDTTANSKKNNLIEEEGIKVRFQNSLSDRKNLSLGYQYSKHDIRYAFTQQEPTFSILLDQGNESLRTHALFGSYQFYWKNTSFDAGARINYLDAWRKIYIEPRLSAQYAFDSNYIFGASYEYRTQPVSQIKESIVSDLSLENQVWTLATPDGFPIITSHKYAMNASYKNDQWLIEIEGYRKTLDGITSLTFGFLNPNPTDNEYRVGDSRILGLDFLVKKKWNDHTSLLTYTLINTENRLSGLNDEQRFPGNWNIRHIVKWSHFYRWNLWDFSAGWVWHSGKVFTEQDAVMTSGEAIAIDFDRVNRSVLPRYHRLDVSASYRFMTRQSVQFKIGLALINTYAQENLINRELRKEPLLDVSLIETDFYGLGFTPNLVLRVQW